MDPQPVPRVGELQRGSLGGMLKISRTAWICARGFVMRLERCERSWDLPPSCCVLPGSRQHKLRLARAERHSHFSV